MATRRSGSTRHLSAADEWLAFHCGVRPTSDPARASFLAGRTLVEIGGLEMGSHEEPETGATFVLQVVSLDTGHRYRLRGPGLREAREIAVTGLAGRFRGDLARQSCQLPARHRPDPVCRHAIDGLAAQCRCRRGVDGICSGQGRRAGDRQRPRLARRGAARRPRPFPRCGSTRSSSNWAARWTA